jgi:polysaccharide pyruvyl transferase WcaK-like protein
MRILVVHAWLRGNLGDVLQLSVLLRALRELSPRVLDLAGYPERPASAAGEILRLCDRHIPEPFAWYWKLAPRSLRAAALEPAWRRQRQALFSRYDAIVCAPGPYLAGYDARAPSALTDITVAANLGLPVVLSSHSIGPLPDDALAVVARATTRVAREGVTADYLRARNIPCVASSDLAFLYPYASARSEGRRPLGAYRLAFLRSNNVPLRSLKLEGGALYGAPGLLLPPAADTIVLATSDERRDRRFMIAAARRLGVASVSCRSVAELVQLVDGASSIVSDRYHPAICAAVLGKTVKVVGNREPHKMQGLDALLTGRSVDELQRLARTGLDAVLDALRQAV